MKQTCSRHCGSISVHTEQTVHHSRLLRNYDTMEEQKEKAQIQISPSLFLKGGHNENIIKLKLPGPLLLATSFVHFLQCCMSYKHLNAA